MSWRCDRGNLSKMARFVVIYSVLCFFVNSVVSKDFLDSLNITSPNSVGFDELYNDGLYAYGAKDWSKAVKLFEQALADFRHEQDVNVHCRLECRNSFRSKTKIKDLELQYFKFTIYNRECVRRCVEKYRGKRSFISRRVRKIFEAFQPYGYLQFAYFKVSFVINMLAINFIMIPFLDFLLSLKFCFLPRKNTSDW